MKELQPAAVARLESARRGGPVSPSEPRRMELALAMYFVYILKSKRAKKFYTGHTDNLSRRILEHNSEKGYYSKRYIPWEICYSESLPTLGDAVKREKYLKSAAGRRWIKKSVEL